MKSFILTSLLFASSAFALDVQTFRPLNMSQGGFNLYDAEEFEKNRFSLALYYNFVKHPLEFGLQNNVKVDDIVNDLHTANLMASYEFSRRLALNLDLPYQYLTDFEDLASPVRTEAQSLGDLLISLPIYLGKLTKRIHVKIIPKAIINTGDNDPFVGEKDALFGLGLALDRRTKRSRWVFNAEYQAREKETLYNLELGDAFKLGLGYNRDFGDLKGFMWVNELTAEIPANVDQKEINSPMEFFTGLRHVSQDEDIIWNLGYAKGLNHGYGSPDYRLFAGINYVFGRAKVPQKAIYKPVIAKPRKAVKVPAVKPRPPVVAVKSKPIKPRFAAPIIVELEKIHFLTNSDRIKTDSMPVIIRLVNILKKHRGIRMLRIEGHTDSQGSQAYNLELSKRRARSVKNRLIALGVDEMRLTSTGFGPSRPIDTNLTKEGRFNNRRVEFKVIKATGPKIIFRIKK